MSMEIRILTHLDKVFQDEAPVECTSYFKALKMRKSIFSWHSAIMKTLARKCSLPSNATKANCNPLASAI